MIIKIMLHSMQDARKLVGIAERIPYDVELHCDRYVVDVKSILGVLSLPRFEAGELHIHTDEEAICEQIRVKLSALGLLANADDPVRRSIFDITVFGEALIDFTSQQANAEGQTLFARIPGGAPANVAVAASRLGMRTAFLGKVGQDMQGDFLRRVLEGEHVNTQGMISDPDYFTTMAFVNVSDQGERSFSFARKPGADMQMQKEEVDVDVLDCTNIFHVGSLSLTDQPSRDTTFYAVKRAKCRGSIISFDPNYRASLWMNEMTARKQTRSMIPFVDIMKLSEEETELLTGMSSPVDAAAELFRQGVKVVVVTLGSEGAFVFCREGGRMVAGFPCSAVDTNGAGDSFWAAFLTKVSQSGKCPDELTLDELVEFARFGNAAASLCVEKEGAMPAMPYLENVAERLLGK